MSGNVSRVTGCRCNETLNPMCACCWGNWPACGDGPCTLCMTIAFFGLCAVERAHASCVHECKSSKNTPDVGQKGRHNCSRLLGTHQHPTHELSGASNALQSTMSISSAPPLAPRRCHSNSLCEMSCAQACKPHGAFEQH